MLETMGRSAHSAYRAATDMCPQTRTAASQVGSSSGSLTAFWDCLQLG